jgi:hypothetical protein
MPRQLVHCDRPVGKLLKDRHPRGIAQRIQSGL